MMQPPPPKSPDAAALNKFLGNEDRAGVPAKDVAIQFEKIDKYTTFIAEYAMKGGDIVLHFFPSPEVHASSNNRKYWFQVFPAILDPVARKVFDAAPPVLQAALVEGVLPSWEDPKTGRAVDSWWLCAQGFGSRVMPRALVDSFLRELDSELDKVKAI